MASRTGRNAITSSVTDSVYETYGAAEPIIVTPKVTNVFAQNFAATERVIVNRGSAGSSKSYSLYQLMCYRFLTAKKKNILIVRKSLPSLRISVLPAMYSIMEEFNIRDRIDEEKVMLNYYYNNNWMHFGSIDDVEKIKCYHPDTEILTEDGFVNIKDVRVGQMVATMNPLTREAMYRPVNHTYAYDYDGDMYSPEDTTNVDFGVTCRHEMLVSIDGEKTLRRVEIRDLKETAFSVVGEYNKNVEVQKVVTNHYEGKVYCVEVAPYHNVMIRYNNRVMWCGQSSDWSYILMEEATDFSYNDFLVLKTRLRSPSKDGLRNQMFLSFNPVDARHWIKTEVVDKLENMREIHSTYKDNPFLDADYVQDLEATRKQNINFWRVMAKGEWGKLENLIYSNWDEISSFPSELPVVYGVDFGYNVPSVLLKIGYTETDIWEEELIYEAGLNNQQFINKMKRVIPRAMRHRPIYADNAEPSRISEMRAAGLNVKPANKKIKEGIDLVQRLKVHIVSSSLNVIKEKSSYCWKLDRNKQPIDEPIEFNDHAQDAERYAVYTHLRRNDKIRLRWL